MGKTTLARQRAIEQIGDRRVAKLEAAGLAVVDYEELCRLKIKRDELEREVKRLQAALAQGPETVVLEKAMVQSVVQD